MDSPYGIASIWAQGDAVIKGVAIMLLIMSIASWWVIVVRAWGLWRLRSSAQGLNDFWHAQSFGQGLQILSAASRHGEHRNSPEQQGVCRWRRA